MAYYPDGGEHDAGDGGADATTGGGFMGATDGQASDVLSGSLPCADGGCGLVGNPDAEADVVTGVVAHPDSGGD